MAESEEQRLWQACTDGDLKIVKELADDPAVDVNWVGEDRGDTPLHRACRFGYLETVKVLLAQEKIGVNKRNRGGAGPFNIACQEGHKEVVSLLSADPRIDPNKLDHDSYTPIFIAWCNGHKEVVSLLLADPRIDPNQANDKGSTPFFMACQEGHKEVVSLLLADPRIDLNKPRDIGATPFLIACENGHREVVSLLLADPRIDPFKPRRDQSSPLWYASNNGHLVVVQHLLASGREIDTMVRSSFNNKTAAKQGRSVGARTTKPADETEEDFQSKTYGLLCADLIDDYERDPVATRHRLRRQPGLREYFIGHLFALVVYHSDSFVIINERLAHADTQRFFRLCARLPLEVQMVLCNRAFGSPKDIILSRNSEPGFMSGHDHHLAAVKSPFSSSPPFHSLAFWFVPLSLCPFFNFNFHFLLQSHLDLPPSSFLLPPPPVPPAPSLFLTCFLFFPFSSGQVCLRSPVVRAFVVSP